MRSSLQLVVSVISPSVAWHPWGELMGDMWEPAWAVKDQAEHVSSSLLLLSPAKGGLRGPDAPPVRGCRLGTTCGPGMTS